MVRNAGKFGKPKRGGKKQFTQNLDEIDKAGMWDGAQEESGSEEESSDDEDDDSKTTESHSEAENVGTATAETSKLKSTNENQDNFIGTNPNNESISQSRSERKKAKNQKKKKTDGGDDDDDDDSENDKDLENLNRATKKSLKISEISKLDVGTPNRKEREAVEKKAAQERYWKLHQAGKTDEAKTDLARLAKIRQEREQAAAFRKAELEAKAKEATDRAALSGRKKK